MCSLPLLDSLQKGSDHGDMYLMCAVKTRRHLSASVTMSSALECSHRPSAHSVLLLGSQGRRIRDVDIKTVSASTAHHETSRGKLVMQDPKVAVNTQQYLRFPITARPT
jgi:hypothetical protein